MLMADLYDVVCYDWLCKYKKESRSKQGDRYIYEPFYFADVPDVDVIRINSDYFCYAKQCERP